MFLAASSAASAQPAQPDHAAFTRLLETYVAPPSGEEALTRVDYDAWRASDADRAALESYIAELEAVAASELSEDSAFAYWVNLYNAVTIRLILDEDPSRSIRQIKPHPFAIGPWGVERVTVEGRELSLDDIEHGILRVEFRQPALVHYGVNCASVGCPNLQRQAWTAESLDARLAEAAREYVNSPRGVRITENGLVVSRIYRWFQEDFGGSEEGVIAHLLDYAEAELAEAIRSNPVIDGHAYDWSLNAAE